MNNLLIIGGAGFIGSHLTELLVKENHNIIVLDNLFLGKEENLEKIRDNITFIKGDYSNKVLIDKIIGENKIDYVFHFAGFSSAPHYYNNEAKGLEIGAVGFVQLLDACKKYNVKRVLYASTSSLYAGMKIQKEDMVVNPFDFYTLTKHNMEQIAKIYNNVYGLESIGFRFFSVYGKNEKHKGKFANLISQFLWAMQKNEEVIFYGDGEQSRDFTYVLDICDAIIRGMKTTSDNAQANIYNIGTSESYSLKEMVDILEIISNLKAKRKYIPNPIKNYVQHTRASVEKIKEELGFKAKFTLKEGIADLLNTESEKNSSQALTAEMEGFGVEKKIQEEV